MRCFVALELPETTPRELVRRSAAARASLPDARWARAEVMHLTLAFLGSIDPALVARLDAALAPIFAAAPALDVTVDGVGAFPPRGQARVVWAGVDAAPPGALGRLHGAVSRALATVRDDRDEAIFEAESRPYRPHVTLARCRPPWPRRAVDDLAEAMSGPPLGGTIDHGTLFESQLLPSGARYRAVSTYPLAMETDVEATA